MKTVDRKMVVYALMIVVACVLSRTTVSEASSEVAGNNQPFVAAHQKLVKDLLEKRFYDPRVRPVKNHRHYINVTVRMNLYQIVDVNERNQHIVLYVWMTQTWQDEFLGWEPDEFDGITSIVVPYQNVWLPDTYLYNGLEMVRENSERWISIILTMNKTQDARAQVIFRHPSLYKFTCNMDILYFPFDKQCCQMTFGSWMYDASGIQFRALQKTIFREDFTESEEWTVISFESKHKLENYSCCEVPFSHFYAYLLIQRKPLHFLVNLVIPTLIITLISFVGFFSPASTNGERTEKVNLGITTLLAMSILLLMVSDQMPTTSNFVPLIGWFYLSIILLISLATVMTSVIITVQKQGHFGKRVSPGVKRMFFQFVGRALLMDMPPTIQEFCWVTERPTQESLIPLTITYSDCSDNNMVTPSPALNVELTGVTTYETKPEKEPIDSSDKAVLYKNPSLEPTPMGNDFRKSSLKKVGSNGLGIQNLDLGGNNNTASSMGSQLRKIQRQLLQLNEYVRSKEDEEKIHAEWEWLAAILDRMLLVIFVFIVTSVTVIIIVVGLVAEQKKNCHA